jgi:pimeloyl-ACP methyl ester carboxylesterase
MLTTNITAANAPTQLVEARNGVRYAYRRFGDAGDVPLVLMQHFRGNLDNWDTELLDTLAAEREVIAFNNTGVSSTNGETPRSVQQMARDAIAFIEALNLGKVDVLGFSLGGFIAQEVALLKPDLVRKPDCLPWLSIAESTDSIANGYWANAPTLPTYQLFERHPWPAGRTRDQPAKP